MRCQIGVRLQKEAENSKSTRQNLKKGLRGPPSRHPGPCVPKSLSENLIGAASGCAGRGLRCTRPPYRRGYGSLARLVHGLARALPIQAGFRIGSKWSVSISSIDRWIRAKTWYPSLGYRSVAGGNRSCPLPVLNGLRISRDSSRFRGAVRSPESFPIGHISSYVPPSRSDPIRGWLRVGGKAASSNAAPPLS